MRTVLPAYLRALVATDVYIFCREEFAYLCKYILEELHCLLLTYAKNVVSYAPFAPYVVWTACTSKFRISGKRCEHMARKVDFRNHSDTFAGCIVKDIPDLILCEITTFTIWSSVVDFAVEKMAHEGLLSDSSNLCESWVLLDLKSPTLVVCKVPVEGVELVYLHDVKVSLYLIHVEEVT